MTRRIIYTKQAPQAIGTYSQAIAVGNTVYLSGQIGLKPDTAELQEDIEAQIRQMFSNLQAVAEASGGSLQDVVKITIYLVDLTRFALLNQIMSEYFTQPYPAREAVGVASLPRGAEVEASAVMVIPSQET